MASEMTLDLAPKYTNTSNPPSRFIIDKKFYEELAEEFYDSVFEHESKLDMETWVDLVAEN